MSERRLTSEQRNELIALSVIILLVGSFRYEKHELEWTLSWPAIAVSLVPWTRWFSSFLFENFRKIKVGDFEFEIVATERKLGISGFTIAASSSAFPAEEQLRLLPRVQAAEVQVTILSSTTSESPVRRNRKERKALARLATKVGHFYLWRVIAERTRPGDSPAFEGGKVELQRAIYYYETAIRFGRRSWAARNGLGSAVGLQGDWAKSREHFFRAIDCDRTKAASWHNLALTFDEERSAKPMSATELVDSRRTEIQYYEQACKCDPTLWNCQYNLAFVRAEVGDPAAVEALERAARINRGRTHEELQKPPDRRTFTDLSRSLSDPSISSQLSRLLA